MTTDKNLIGLDIGGANLKAATAGGEARSRPFELWKHPDQLGTALIELLHGWQPTRLAATMTGELCDCFFTKRDGVRRILAEVEKAFPAIPIGVWSMSGQFVTVDQARKNHLSVAAANWHALATMVGSLEPFRHDDKLLLIDVGSTTSDIIPIQDGKPAAIGSTDRERLLTKELVYTGARRTPICALIQGPIAAELFATTLDVYLVLDMIAGNVDDRQTADARPATAEYAYERLARMLGGDFEIIPKATTLELAASVFQKQCKQLTDAFVDVIDTLGGRPDAVIVAGSGEFLALAAWKGYPFKRKIPVYSLTTLLSAPVSTAACAYAVAVLAEKSWPI